MPIVSTTKMNWRQYLQLGEDPPGLRLELVNGEVAVSPSPNPIHQYAAMKLASLLSSYAEEHDLGQVLPDSDTIFGEYDVRRPDLVFFTKGRTHLITDDGIEGAPDLCVEVLSPSSVAIDRKDKFAQYAAAKVHYYWIVDPSGKTIEAYRLSKGKYVGRVRGSGSDVVKLPPFTDLKIPLATLWRPTK